MSLVNQSHLHHYPIVSNRLKRPVESQPNSHAKRSKRVKWCEYCLIDGGDGTEVGDKLTSCECQSCYKQGDAGQRDFCCREVSQHCWPECTGPDVQQLLSTCEPAEPKIQRKSLYDSVYSLCTPGDSFGARLVLPTCIRYKVRTQFADPKDENKKEIA